MMVPNSKSFHKIVALTLFTISCGTVPQPKPVIHKCQAVIIVDKTNSVNYNVKLTGLRNNFVKEVQGTYITAKRDIQLSRLTITGNTGVIPDRHYFDKIYPEGDEDSRIIQAEREKWKTEKKRWLSDEVQQVFALIDTPCNSNTTDIFSIFSGIQDIQRFNSPWDTINVFIFSDMTNTASPINMLKEVNIDNAKEKGKEVCRKLMTHGRISADTTGNLHLIIYTPDNMNNTAQVSQFWKGFFQQWGLADDHYHFE